ncbi:MAG: FGGY-family carbohydrate kinase [Kineosporiaceae bacterium]
MSSGRSPQVMLGVDLGTGGPKVALVDTDGTVLGHEAERTGITLLPGGGVEQDPEDWWRAIVLATRRLLDRGVVAPERITGVCMSSQWGGLIPVDARGRQLHNAVIWMDARGGDYSRAVTGGGLTVPGTGYNARRLAGWLRRTGGAPTRTGKDPVGQAGWLREYRPDVYAATAYLLDVPEYLTMRLTGRPVAGFDTAVLRWCTDNRDPARIRWDPRLLRWTGFASAELPDLQPPATVVGPILPGVAAELGLPPDVQVVTGTGDTTAAAIGAGAVADYQAHLYVGTSAWLSCHVPFKRTDVFRNIASLPSVVPDRYWVATVQDVAGKAVDWLLDRVVYPDDGMFDGGLSGALSGGFSSGGPAGAGAVPADALDRLNALAASAPPGSNGVVFTPWLNGERTPVDDPDLRGGWANLSLSTTQADLARSVFEGIALNARWMKESVDRFLRRGLPGGLTDVRFVGGGARSVLWSQTMADVLGVTVHQVRDPVLANARGAALIAGVALGELEWAELGDRVPVAASYRPDPANRAVYDERYRMFTGLYRGLRGVYSR